MGYDFFTAGCPTKEQRNAFIERFGELPNSDGMVEGQKRAVNYMQHFYFRAATEDWVNVRALFLDKVSQDVLFFVKERPFRPSQKDYATHKAKNPPTSHPNRPMMKSMILPNGSVMTTAFGPGIDPGIPLILNSQDPTVAPNYDKCAVCCQPAKARCGACKVVQYCNRECQKTAWKGGHKKHCRKAVQRSLYQAISGNGEYHLDAAECQVLADALQDSTDPFQKFLMIYLEAAATLNGCFVC